jgi:hypothetical protein
MQAYQFILVRFPVTSRQKQSKTRLVLALFHGGATFTIKLELFSKTCLPAGRKLFEKVLAPPRLSTVRQASAYKF